MALGRQQIGVALLTIFGVLALSLATVGLYAVMSYAVSQSTRELGLRMALGATISDVTRLVVSQGLGITTVGVVLGVAVALASAQFIKSLLYRVSPRNPVAFGSAVLIMLLAALAACFVPAWRATHIDPVRALRE